MAQMKLALAGNPNCGKTTLFNALTGANQYVGNWPGVTVEKKEGHLKGHKDVIVTDLPGIYSLSPYTLEEVVTRNYIISEHPDAIINLIDASNIERNLYLTTQITEMGLPVIVALNMMDIVRKNGDQIDTKKLASELGCPVVEISALRGEGLDQLINTAVETAKAKQATKPSHEFNKKTEAALTNIEQLLSSAVPAEYIRWFAVKAFERDEDALSKFAVTADTKAAIEAEIAAVETAEDDDAESIITNGRYEYIGSVIGRCYKRKRSGLTTSDKIDRIVTNRILALPIFAGIMFLVYYIAGSTLGAIVTDFTNDTLFGTWIQPNVQAALEGAGASDWLVSLVVDGIIGGIGAPVGFAPQMAIVFLLLSFLEDVGYMARVAFIMDRIFRRFGLSGKSFIPFMISMSCGVPAIMGTRTIENEKDRRMTMMTTTFIPCGAKLPVIALIAGYIADAWWISPIMYFIGIVSIIVSCIILKKTKMFGGEPAPFVMELPQYHMPQAKTVLLHTWERVWAFLKKAGTILFACCAVMWFLGSFGIQDGTFGMVDTDYCFLSYIGGAIAWIFAPLGFGTWQAVASSLSGFVAKEGIVSTMGVLAGVGEIEEYATNMHAAFAAFFPTSIAAFSFLVFNLLNSPCLAAISTLAREMKSKKGVAIALIFQNVFSYCISLIVYQIGGLFLFGGELTFGVGTVAAIIVLAILIFLLVRPDPTKKAHTSELAGANA